MQSATFEATKCCWIKNTCYREMCLAVS